MIDLEFDSSSDAEAFRAAARDVGPGPGALRLAESPEARIVEAVGTGEYRRAADDR
jgi:hypothetical protein